MVWPLVIGAAIGAIAGGMSGGDGWDWKRAGLGGILGAFTGGAGSALLGGAGAATVGAGGIGAAGLGGAAGAGSAAGTGAAGMAAIQGGGGATMAASGTAAGLGTTAYTAPALANAPWISGQTATGLNMPWKDVASKIDFSALGNVVGEPKAPPIDDSYTPPRLLEPPTPRRTEGESIEDELALAAANMQRRSTRTATGLKDVPPLAAARGGIMQVPSGSLTGGQLIGPGTGKSDSIRSSIFPDIASKLGASSSLPGKGHSVQRAALSDGEYVLTAKAVEGFGKKAGAPPGQEREYGSKLLDNVMNQMQRV